MQCTLNLKIWIQKQMLNNENGNVNLEIEKLVKKNGSLLVINLDYFKQNFNDLNNVITKYSGEISCVLKNNAYGIGIKDISYFCNMLGNKIFFVATYFEGIKLQEILLNIGSDFKIYVLHGIFCDEMEILFKYDLIPVLNSYTQIEKWVNFARKKNTKLKAIINIETGLNRLGLDLNEIEKFYENKDLILKDLDIEYIMSHLACSDDVTSKHNEVQLMAFNKIRKMFPDFKFSLSASYGIYLGGDYVSDLARIGVALYGGNPTPHLKNPMKNVVNLYSSIIQIKTIKQGDCVGYGCLFVAEKDTRIGIVSVGYADGIIRSASNNSFVYINNKKAKILGRISMDLIAVDITNFDENEAVLNSLVEIIGENQDVNDLAKAAGSIHCEVLSNISNRYPKIFIYNNVIYYDSILGKL